MAHQLGSASLHCLSDLIRKGRREPHNTCKKISFWLVPAYSRISNRTVFLMFFFYYTPRERSSGGYIEITLSVRLSVRLSVQIRVRPITFLWFDIGLPYLAHGCFTMRRCVAYFHDPDTNLNFDLKVKFIGFLTCFVSGP